MDTKKEDTNVKTAPEAPAMPAPGEPGPGPSAVPSEPFFFLMFLTASTCSGADVPLRKTSRNLQTIVVAVKWTQVREVKG